MSELLQAFLGLCGLAVTCTTVYAAAQSRKANKQVSVDDGNGSLRTLVRSGFEMISGQVTSLGTRVNRLEAQQARNTARLADFNESLSEVRRAVGLQASAIQHQAEAIRIQAEAVDG